MPRHMPLQIPKLMHRAALHLDPRPTLLHFGSQPLSSSIISNPDRFSPRLINPSTNPLQHSLDSLCKSSKSNTTFCPSASPPVPPTPAPRPPCWRSVPATQSNPDKEKPPTPFSATCCAAAKQALKTPHNSRNRARVDTKAVVRWIISRTEYRSIGGQRHPQEK